MAIRVHEAQSAIALVIQPGSLAAYQVQSPQALYLKALYTACETEALKS